MCGIVGQIRFDGAPVNRGFIERMTAAIAHRGPDGEGVHVDGSVGLGHRRLAIIDLATGQQPMGTPDGKVWITYNGEVYNFKELRSELEEKGHEFRTSSDTEVLLHAWRQWGAEMVPKLRGMFAFCLVDFAQRKWLIARDPFGIKPLFYRLTPEAIEFSSELHAIQSTRGRLEAVEWFLRYQYIPAPYTIFHDVWKLLPAHFMQGDFDGPLGEPKRYWRMDFKEEPGLSEDEWLERFNEAFRSSVKAHLVADVPVGLLLSGGVDSTLVAREMSRMGGDFKAFTLDFDVEDFGELDYATQAAKRYGIELLHTTQGDDFWDELPELVRHYGEPFGDNSMIPTWRVTRLARDHVPVVLGGDGGDEGFGGYKNYGRWLEPPNRKKRRKRLKSRPSWRHLVSLLWAYARNWGLPVNSVFDYELNVQYTPLDSTKGNISRQTLWRHEFVKLTDKRSPAFELAARTTGRARPLDFAQEMDFLTYQPGAILTKSDVASMYHGLEVRTPFLDYEVMKVASGLPAGLRAQWQKNAPRLKILLRKALEPDFDEEFVYRRKTGFGIPRVEWFSPGAAGHGFIEDALFDKSGGLHEWFDTDMIRGMFDGHPHERDYSTTLWLMLVLALWRRQNPDVSWT